MLAGTLIIDENGTDAIASLLKDPWPLVPLQEQQHVFSKGPVLLRLHRPREQIVLTSQNFLR